MEVDLGVRGLNCKVHLPDIGAYEMKDQRMEKKFLEE